MNVSSASAVSFLFRPLAFGKKFSLVFEMEPQVEPHNYRLVMEVTCRLERSSAIHSSEPRTESPRTSANLEFWEAPGWYFYRNTPSRESKLPLLRGTVQV